MLVKLSINSVENYNSSFIAYNFQYSQNFLEIHFYIIIKPIACSFWQALEQKQQFRWNL